MTGQCSCLNSLTFNISAFAHFSCWVTSLSIYFSFSLLPTYWGIYFFLISLLLSCCVFLSIFYFFALLYLSRSGHYLYRTSQKTVSEGDGCWRDAVQKQISFPVALRSHVAGTLPDWDFIQHRDIKWQHWILQFLCTNRRAVLSFLSLLGFFGKQIYLQHKKKKIGA